MPMAVAPTDRSTPERQDVFRPTRRILAMLAACDRFGFLTSHQLKKLDGGSAQKVTRLLQKCVEHGLLVQPGEEYRASLTPFYDARPRVFALTRKGAQLLHAAGIPVDLDLDRATRNKRAVLLQHTIETAELCSCWDTEVAAAGNLQLIDHNHRREYLPLATRELRKPFCLRARVRPSDFSHLSKLIKTPMDIPVEPDRLITLVNVVQNNGWSFAIELDRGTEDITATTLKGRATVFRKLLGYYAAWAADAHIEQWGPMFKSFRVLTITTAERRVQNMLEAQQRITLGAASGLFLYTTMERFAERGALAPIWTSAERESISLLDRRD